MVEYKTLSHFASYVVNRISTGDISRNDYVTTDCIKQNKQGVSEAENLPPNPTSATKFQEQDILIANIRPYLKKVWFADKSGAASSDVLTIRTKAGFDPRFVYYNLFQDEFFNHMMRGSKGTKMPRGDKDQVMDFILPNWPRSYQETIGSLLSAIDEKIHVNTKITRELESLVRLIFEYWFLQYDFPDINDRPYKSSGGKMEFNEVIGRNIPFGWKVREIGNYISPKRGISYNGTETKGDGIPMINLNSFNVNSTYKPDGLKTFSGNVSEKHLEPYDLVMCNTQQTALDPEKDIIGKSFLVPDVFDSKAVCSHHVTKITVEGEAFKHYINHWFSTEYFHRYISGYCAGTNILGLNFEGVESHLIPIPENGLLEKFEKISQSVERQKSMAIKENQELATLRDWLLPMLMNGQVKVGAGREVAKAAEPEVGYGK